MVLVQHSKCGRRHYRKEAGEKNVFKFNAIDAATAYVKSRAEHDAELRGLPSLFHLSNPK